MFKGAVLRYLISDALSLLGNSIAGVVLPLVLLARTGDVLAAGSLALICAVPQFVCGILGGALLDRVNRKAVCVVSDLISALSIALLPVVDDIWGLSFAWFVALGLLGAVGDVPGMTARDALLPEVCEREGVDLQRFVGASQSMGSLITIAGPAVAALLIGFMPDVDALWVTAACSCAAAAVSATLPKGVGAIREQGKHAEAPADSASADSPAMPAGTTATTQEIAAEPASPKAAGLRGLLETGRAVLTDGLSALFADNRLLRATTLLSFGVTMIMASWQGIVLPAYFTQLNAPELTGLFVSAMGVGMLVGSLGYTALANRLSRRGWLTVSLLGMSVGAVGMGMLPDTPLLLASATLVGLFAGPASALLGFFAFERVPENRRGSAMGTLNALYLIIGPMGTFLGSTLITTLQISTTGLVLAGLWIIVTATALIAPALRDLGDGDSLDDDNSADGVQLEHKPKAA